MAQTNKGKKAKATKALRKWNLQKVAQFTEKLNDREKESFLTELWNEYHKLGLKGV